MITGNALILALLVGLPFVRGLWRAQDSRRAYGALAACLYGGVPSGNGGVGAIEHEAGHFAAQLVRRDGAWLGRCQKLLNAVVPAPALFVLPSVKGAEQRVREAAAMLRSELAAVADYAAGERMPQRPLRAMHVLRGAIHQQLEQSGLEGDDVLAPLRLAARHAVPLPARVPIYAAPDAVVSLWGDDQTLRVSALDSTGLSYLEADPGAPFVRARIARPRLLHGFLKLGERPWLLWATPAGRCGERASGCYGKTSSVAVAPMPLVRLPEARKLAGHLAGRADRSVMEVSGRLLMATATAERRARIREFAVPTGFQVGSELPPLNAIWTWPTEVDRALLVNASGEALALGTSADAERSTLFLLRPDTSEALAQLPAGPSSWSSSCTDRRRVAFAFGNGQQVIAGELRRSREGWTRWLWQPVPLLSSQEIDGEQPSQDKVAQVCVPGAVVTLAIDSQKQLRAILCRSEQPECHVLPLAKGVTRLAAVATRDGALVAYSGDNFPQIRVRDVNARTGRVGEERVPAACWSPAQGLCGTPTLARLGSRIVLAAPEKTDLLALESGDEGETWSAIPLL